MDNFCEKLLSTRRSRPRKRGPRPVGLRARFGRDKNKVHDANASSYLADDALPLHHPSSSPSTIIISSDLCGVHTNFSGLNCCHLGRSYLQACFRCDKSPDALCFALALGYCSDITEGLYTELRSDDAGLVDIFSVRSSIPSPVYLTHAIRTW